jgi:Transposase
MPSIAEAVVPVTGGVDTHADVHVAAAVDQVGRVLDTQALPADAAGYQAALAWMRAHGELAKVGVEGTSSYGAGLARYLAAWPAARSPPSATGCCTWPPSSPAPPAAPACASTAPGSGPPRSPKASAAFA